MRNLLKILLVAIILVSCRPEEDKYQVNLRTLVPENVTNRSSLLKGEIVNLGSEPITRKGFCWLEEIQVNNPPHPLIGDNPIEVSIDGGGLFTYTLSNLTARTRYYYRAFAVTSLGVAYGEVYNFITSYDTITDIDGNVYTIVKIGDQYWTRENFNSTRLRDGTLIPNQIEDFYWGSNTPELPAMCWYHNNRELYQVPYGALYNWFAASHPLIAPEGWRVPSIDDYTTLKETLGGNDSNAGDRMKVTGSFWQESDNASGAKPNNDSDFSAYPAGGRGETQGFQELHLFTTFWASSSYINSTNIADFAWLQYNSPNFYEVGLTATNYGFSLRLLKND